MLATVDIVSNGVIGVCFLAITASILWGAFTSEIAFFRYVGRVYAAFIGTCGLARTARLVGFIWGISSNRTMELITVTDGISAIVGFAAAIAIVGITIVVTRREARKSAQ